MRRTLVSGLVLSILMVLTLSSTTAVASSKTGQSPTPFDQAGNYDDWFPLGVPGPCYEIVTGTTAMDVPSWFRTAVDQAAAYANNARNASDSYLFDAYTPSFRSKTATGCTVNLRIRYTYRSDLAPIHAWGFTSNHPNPSVYITPDSRDLSTAGMSTADAPYWCEGGDPSNNAACYDVRTFLLHEFGHVLNLADRSTRPALKWSVMGGPGRNDGQSDYRTTRFGECDLAAFQIRYGLRTFASRYATCLGNIPVSFGTLQASATSIPYGGSVTFTVALKVSSAAPYSIFRNDPLPARAVRLDGTVNGTTWSSYGSMSETSTQGTYRITLSNMYLGGTFRAVFADPGAAEALTGGTSGSVTVAVRSPYGG